MCNYTDLISHCHQKRQVCPAAHVKSLLCTVTSRSMNPWQAESGSVSHWTWIYFNSGLVFSWSSPQCCLPDRGVNISAGNVLGIKSPSAAAHTAAWENGTIWHWWQHKAMLEWAILGCMCLVCAHVCVTMSMCRSIFTDITELSSEAWKLVHTWFLSWLGKASTSCCH